MSSLDDSEACDERVSGWNTYLRSSKVRMVAPTRAGGRELEKR
jgi:hypothetical protein